MIVCTAPYRGAASTLPLDAYTSGLVATTSPHRRLLNSYAGSLIRVMRSSDSTESDIGYDGSNFLDQTALTTFVGGGTGSVTRIYFQEGSGNYLIPIDQKMQIVISGTVQKSGNIPTPKCSTGASFGYKANSAISISGTTMSCYMGRTFGASATEAILGLTRASDGLAWNSTDGALPLVRDGTNSAVYGYRNNAGVTTPITVAGYFACGARLDGSNMIVHAAGTSQSGASTGTLAVTNLALGSSSIAIGGPSDNSLSGECVVWSTDIGSTNMAAILTAYDSFMAS